MLRDPYAMAEDLEGGAVRAYIDEAVSTLIGSADYNADSIKELFDIMAEGAKDNAAILNSMVKDLEIHMDQSRKSTVVWGEVSYDVVTLDAPSGARFLQGSPVCVTAAGLALSRGTDYTVEEQNQDSRGEAQTILVTLVNPDCFDQNRVEVKAQTQRCAPVSLVAGYRAEPGGSGDDQIPLLHLSRTSIDESTGRKGNIDFTQEKSEQ